MIVRVLVACCLSLVLAACSRTLYPVTNGSYRALPAEGTPMAIWGVNADATVGAETWLERRGMVIVSRSKVRDAVKPEGGEADVPMKRVLTAAAAAGAKVVVFVENAANPSFPASVTIHGIDAASGDQLWEASAWFEAKELGPTDADLESLACQALATLWGFRPAGYQEIPSSHMCYVDGSGPHGHPSGSHRKLG